MTEVDRGETIKVGTFVVTITPRDDAAESLVEIAKRYWAVAGTDDYGRISWREGTRHLGVGRPHVVAAAGATVEVAGVACPECQLEPWQPRSRSALDALARGVGVHGTCASCDLSLPVDALRERTDLDAHARRAASVAKAVQQAGEAKALAEWNRRCSVAVSERFPLQLADEWEDDLPDWPLDLEVATLACLRYASTVTPIPSMSTWNTPLTPDAAWTRALIVEWVTRGPLDVHPDTAPSTFGWTPATNEALLCGSPDHTACHASWEAVLEHMPSPRIASYVPDRLKFYVPYGPTLGTAAEHLDTHLANKFRLDLRDGSPRMSGLPNLAERLIAGETVRYFDMLLHVHNLPPVADNHRPRLVEAARLVARARPLGEAYCVVWRAVRAAAASAQANLRAPKANMTTHGVNQFEQGAQRAADPELKLGRWHEDSRVPLSAMTRTTFLSLLGADPMATSVLNVGERLVDAEEHDGRQDPL